MNSSLNVSVLVNESHDLLETPHAAAEHAHDVLHDLVARFGGLALDVGDDGANGFDDCDDEAAKGSGSEVVEEGSFDCLKVSGESKFRE
jgi:hypothetical protein